MTFCISTQRSLGFSGLIALSGTLSSATSSDVGASWKHSRGAVLRPKAWFTALVIDEKYILRAEALVCWSHVMVTVPVDSLTVAMRTRLEARPASLAALAIIARMAVAALDLLGKGVLSYLVAKNLLSVFGIGVGFFSFSCLS